MSKEKEILDKELSFNYGDELDKIQNHISTLRFVAISSVNSLEEKDKEIERLKQEHEAIKKYVHNHTITYIDNGIECCKPDEYFNISWVEDMLNGNFENLDVLFEDSDK